MGIRHLLVVDPADVEVAVQVADQVAVQAADIPNLIPDRAAGRSPFVLVAASDFCMPRGGFTTGYTHLVPNPDYPLEENDPLDYDLHDLDSQSNPRPNPQLNRLVENQMNT